MIKILMVAGDMHVGGIENQLMHLVRNIDKDMYQVDFTSTMSNAFYREEIEKLGSTFILIPKMDWRKPNEYCKALYKVMKEGKYDIVHSHELFHSGITLYLAYKAGIPCRFAHAHNWCDHDGINKVSLKRKMYNFFMQKMINKYSTVQIACSSWAGRFLYGSKQQKKSTYHLVYNSVDTNKFIDHYNDIEVGEFVDDWINVLNVARVTTVKNQMFLVLMAKEIKKRNEHIRILCAGDGEEDYCRLIEKEIDCNGLNDYIKMLGVRKDIDSLMRKSKAFILPSYYEGMPLVMIEAQASGLQCLSANTYSPEVDFGIETLTWLSLDDGVESWVDALEIAVKKQRALKKDVVMAIKQKKFDSKMFSEIMSDLYYEDYQKRRHHK